jgi:hypothetical protein
VLRQLLTLPLLPLRLKLLLTLLVLHPSVPRYQI